MVCAGWIVTLMEGLCKGFLQDGELKICGAIDKERGLDLGGLFPMLCEGAMDFY